MADSAGFFVCFRGWTETGGITRTRTPFYTLERMLQRVLFVHDFADRRTMDGQTDGQQTDIFCVGKIGLKVVFVTNFSRNSAKTRK
jgi:hypothetical protein